jgi:hypothetical protein
MKHAKKYLRHLAMGLMGVIIAGLYIASIGAITVVDTGSQGSRVGKRIIFAEDSNTASLTTADTLVRGYPVMTFHTDLVAAATVTPQCGMLKADGSTKKWFNGNAITDTGTNSYHYSNYPCEYLRFTIAGGDTVTIHAWVRNW